AGGGGGGRGGGGAGGGGSVRRSVRLAPGRGGRRAAGRGWSRDTSLAGPLGGTSVTPKGGTMVVAGLAVSVVMVSVGWIAAGRLRRPRAGPPAGFVSPVIGWKRLRL